MAIRVKSQDATTTEVKPDLARVLVFSKQEGWFVFSEIEIDKSVLDKHGKVLHKSEPDIYPIFKNQVLDKIRDIFGL